MSADHVDEMDAFREAQALRFSDVYSESDIQKGSDSSKKNMQGQCQGQSTSSKQKVIFL